MLPNASWRRYLRRSRIPDYRGATGFLLGAVEATLPLQYLYQAYE